MKAVILAGGLGTRLSEETAIKPKPMVEVGGKPILWHILKIYASHGITDFIICCGYKGYLIKEYFANYFLHTSDVTFDLKSNAISVHQKRTEPWTISLIDTGDESMTGGRLKRVESYLKDEEAFCLTYGDGVGNIDIQSAVEFHKSHGRIATVTAVVPPGRFGALEIKDHQVSAFQEKPAGDGARINGGFFVLSPKIFHFIQGDNTILEQDPLINLSKQGELMAYSHDGFWQPMDTLRDKNLLEELWASGNAPWKSWE